jgi:serine/threonine-protein kinase RsbW
MTTNEHFKDVLILQSDPQQVTKVEHYLENISKLLNLDEIQFNKLLVAATEAVNNGIIHGNNRNPKKKVTLTCEYLNDTLIVTVEDEGTGINPAALPDPLSEENLLRENGRGIFLMRSLMDEVGFAHTSHGAAVIMKMNLK